MDIDCGKLSKKQRVKFDIELKILTGEYQAGDLVPSVRSLEKLYKIGRSTSQIILESMSQEGTLIMEQGIGFRVNGKAIRRLRKEHMERLMKMIEQVGIYAHLLEVDAVKVMNDIQVLNT